MTTVGRFDGDVRITGNLTVDGNLPTVARADIAQDANRVFVIPMTSCRVWDAPQTLLPGTAANDDLGLVRGTLGTNSLVLSAGDLKAAGATTRYAGLQIPIPAEYDAGESLTLRLSAGMQTTVADNSATVDVQVYKADREGAVGSDLCATSVQGINSLTFSDKDFVITPTGLAPGDLLDVRIAVAVNDAATATAVTAAIGAVELLADVRG